MKIRTRFALLIMLLTAGFALSVVTVMETLLRDHLVSAQEEWAETLVRSVAEGVAQDTIDGEILQARDYLRRIVAKDTALSYIYVTSFDGRLFSHTFDDEFPKALAERLLSADRALSHAVFSTERGDIHEVIAPLIEGMDAYLHIGVSHERINELIADARDDLVLVILTVAIVGLGVALTLGYRIGQPLRQLVDQIQRFGQVGDNIKIEVGTSEPDIKNLAGAFNEMVASRWSAEAELRESEQQLRLVTDALPALITYVDTSQRYRFVNKVAERWFARSQSEIVGHTIAEVLDQSTTDDTHVRSMAALAGESQSFEKRQLYPDGQERWISSSYIPHKNEAGEIVGSLALVIDISERHILEERLHRSQKMEAVGQLTGGIAHEFNNLLQVVAGNIALLEENVPSDLVTGRSFDAINRNVTRGADLTSRLLSFSRQQPLAPKALVIDKILAEMQELLRQTLGETIEVKIGSVKGIWIAEADPGQLESALLNLALNARDAMPGGGIITLSADNIQLDERMAATHEEEASGDYVMLSLADNGSGMSEDDISHAFEPFFTTKDVGKGTGLGLSMVYGFAQQSGGFVEIESELGSGTTMRLYLPRLVGTKEDEAATQGALLEAAATADGTILLVEDDADVRESLAAQLTSLGYRVIEAEDGTAALAALSDAPNIDLLFTDVVMPGGLSGVELARRTLALRPELKILYSTGYSEEFIVEAGDMPDSAIVLRKPYDKSKLAATIAQTLN
ncbi:MAG: PAS domain-containing protein [Rhodospirillaceae bacterium]|nr:PAS domain-containing protein [Rhodospirillaceae bacterium]